MRLDPTSVLAKLNAFEFERLFVEDLGWNRQALRPHEVAHGGSKFALKAVAEKRGMLVLVCKTSVEGELPEANVRFKIGRLASRIAHEHLLIFADERRAVQVWQWIKREPGKPARCRSHTHHATQAGDSLIQKLERLVVTLAEEEKIKIVDVVDRARDAFDVDQVTRKFYEQFKKEHKAFLGFIEGVASVADRSWYASLMLNRLMFVYFIQKKGFLDGGDTSYLRRRLEMMQKGRGKDRFHSFYRHFLLRLFHEGLGSKKRNPELDALLGKVPYLNGGLFDVHAIEEANGNIRIPDEAFERIFKFFDSYEWHLDARSLTNDNEINPDVLGYIFEKYINNQNEMGAYYTQDEITEYIAQSVLVPLLVNRAAKAHPEAFASDAAWRTLREDPERYIPSSLMKGVDLVLPKGMTNNRDTWPPKIDPAYALPGESWPQVLSRRTRAEELSARLRRGEVTSVSDLVTFNLNSRQFIQDMIEACQSPSLLLTFYKLISGVTVLDPTCGSGAFLFAALNVLEPLYDACLDRMESLVTDGLQAVEATEFRTLLQEMAGHPSRHYFIFKAIILNNLYGVDIMDEAVEICKLRLFLKLVAQVSHVDQLEPLPDIDFNVRPGNTLVGYVSKEEMKGAVSGSLDFEGAGPRLERAAQEVDDLYIRFRRNQTQVGSVHNSEAKATLRAKSRALTDQVNQYLAGEYGVEVGDKKGLEKWLDSHQPFHWFIEYYGILKKGGFDAIVGNPPYVEVPKNLNRSFLRATFKTALEKWSRDEDLYAFVVERSLKLLNPHGHLGMILPLSLAFSTKKPFVALRQVLMKEHGNWWWSHFDRIPDALFGSDVRTRCTIALHMRASGWQGGTTSLLRWTSEYRPHLFSTLAYARINVDISAGIPKVGSQIQADALTKLLSAKTPLGIELPDAIPFPVLEKTAPRFPQPCVYIGGTAYNWFPVWREIPQTTDERGRPSLPARTAGYKFKDEDTANGVFALLASSLGYWWWAVASDGFNLKKWLLDRFPISYSKLSPECRKDLAKLGAKLKTALKKHYVYKDNKGRIGNFFLPACKSEVATIDEVLADHVGGLSKEFFEDIRAFNALFSRAELPEDGEADAIDE